MNALRRRTLSLAAACGLLCAPFATGPGPLPDAAARPAPAPRAAPPSALLWMQTAAEYRAATRQTFAAARTALDRALADRRWTAALEQVAELDYETLPPALCIDIDESVLDNSPFQARLAQDGKEFSPDGWALWVEERNASPVPGALAFLIDAARLGVTVFYVTNREARLEAATRDNLARLGFPLPTGDGVDAVLTRNEHDDAGSDKSPRRASVAKTHRILLLLGDDLNDFAPGARLPRAERDRIAGELEGRFGTEWFVLPNPLYGSWERALGADPSAALDTKR